MEDRNDRERQLTDRIGRALLADAETFAAYHSDAATHMRIRLLRDFMLTADEAMRFEGIDREVRDRVAHWLLFGRPPEDPEQDPNAQVEKATWAAVQERLMAQNLAGPEPLLSWPDQDVTPRP